MTEEDRMNQDINRFLSHVVFNSKLHKIMKRFKTLNVQEMNRWYDKNNDYEVS